MRSPMERFITGENRADINEKYNRGRIASKGAKKEQKSEGKL